MTYKVIRESSNGGDVDFIVSWYSDKSDPTAAIRLYRDGCIKFIWLDQERIKLKIDGWFYSDEAKGIHTALGMALKEGQRRSRKPLSQAELDAFIGNKEENNLTLNRSETIKFFRCARWRKREGGGVEVEYEGKWLHLCRTDLHDDIRTWSSWASHADINSVEYYRQRIAYGARITDDAFFVVDALSDG
jgi:hypothetical protein